MAFLANPNPVSFGRSIYDAINEHNLAADKAERAKQIVEQKYSYEVFRKKLLNAYNFINVSIG